MAAVELTGVFPALVTPFDAWGEVDLKALRRNLQGLGGAPLGGYLVLGTTGEFPHLTEQEKELVLASVSEDAGDRLVIAQTGAPSTRQTIGFTRRAAELGAGAALVVAPSYYGRAMGERELERFYTAVAESSPIPILLYNIPQCTGFDLSVELVVGLAEHGNIAGIKDSGGDLGRIAALVAAVPTGWPVLVGADAILLAGLIYGAAGAILAAANVIPYELCDLFRLHTAGEDGQALELERRLAPALRAMGTYGLPGYKAAMGLLGYVGGFPREPLLPLEEAQGAELVDALRAAKLVRL